MQQQNTTITATEIHANARYTNVDGKRVVLSADQQRELFGFPIFGRKPVSYMRDRQAWRVSFSTISRDTTFADYSNERVAAMANSGEKACRNLDNGKINN